MIQLSLRETYKIKGIAIMMLLFHHLFSEDVGADINRDGIIQGGELLFQNIASASKLCVAIFVFLSGYGVAKSYKNSWLNFYVHRFIKLYSGFWLIWILFVPIGVFFFGRTFPLVYGNHIPLFFSLDFLGLLNCIGEFGYNPTWWFMSCIILLYMLTPLIHKTIRFWYLWILFGIIHCFVHLPGISPIVYYLNAYVLGFTVVRYETNIGSCLKRMPALPVASILLAGMLYFRVFEFWGGQFYDAFISLFFVFVLSQLKFGLIDILFDYMGRHSMNIFLYHTFIYYYYMHDFVYLSPNPLIVYIILLSICFIIEFVILKIKRLIRYDLLIGYAEEAVLKKINR